MEFLYSIVENPIVLVTILVINTVLMIVFLITTIIAGKGYKELNKRYLSFMSKLSNGENLEGMMQEYLKQVNEISKRSKNNEVEIKNNETLLNILNEKKFDEVIKNQLELKMLLKQCPDVIKMRKKLDETIVEVQLKQLETDIRECVRQMQTGDSFSEEVFLRYDSLKKERDALLNSQGED